MSYVSRVSYCNERCCGSGCSQCMSPRQDKEPQRPADKIRPKKDGGPRFGRVTRICRSGRTLRDAFRNGDPPFATKPTAAEEEATQAENQGKASIRMSAAECRAGSRSSYNSLFLDRGRIRVATASSFR